MNCVPKFRSFLWGNHVAGNTRTLAIGLGMNRTKSTLAKSLRSNNWTQSETFDELLYTIAGMHMPLLERIIRHRHLCGMSSTSTNGPRQLYAIATHKSRLLFNGQELPSQLPLSTL